MQLELFKVDPYAHLFPYWKERLASWPRDVFEYRHYRNTTGWSMATGGFCFARLLFGRGQLTRDEFRRFFRLDRRVRRWDRKDETCMNAE
jgi:hypothetical protein